jgi:mono/diheme cytochrome c family protein
MIHKRIIRFLSAALCLLMTTTSCDRTRNDKGYEYFPDMAHSLAYESYTENPNFPDGNTMQIPPENTVSREIEVHPYPASPEGRAEAAAALSNPLESTAENIAEGERQYNIFCSGCHGISGNGEGHLYTSKRYAVKPASLISEKMMAAPEGDIYHVISAGYQVMGAHGHMIRPADRWKIAMFVKRELQGNTLK